jgi:mannose-6-phosphate isomerase-like protein (cupin superfamily)
MATHAVVNIKDIEDMAQRYGYAPNMEVRFPTAQLGLENSAFSYQRLAPNFRQPFGHKHRRQEELYVIVGGGGRMKLDDEIIELGQWDAVRVPSETIRCVEAGADGIEYLAFGAPNTGRTEEDAEPHPSWWTD